MGNYSVQPVAGATHTWSILSSNGAITAWQGTPQITIQWTEQTAGQVAITIGKP